MIIRQFKLIRKIQLTIVSLFLSIGFVYSDPIGDIVESTGIGKIVRQNEDINVDGTMPIVLYDRAETAMGSMLIEFIDSAELALKEHTEVYIDEIYYDPDPNLSKMSMRMVMGTARFASGSKGLINKANIDIQTPTATIGIRGTDFTTTIDELGRSLIVLLPDINGDPSGEISVSNLAGTVILNQPYQATMVSTMDSNPTSPVTISGLTPSMIDNMFIVNPPSEVKQAIEDQARDEQDQDSGMLDVDFLEFNELEQDALKDSEEDLEFSELDIDLLEVDFLRDLLEVIEEADALGEKEEGSFSDRLVERGFGLQPDNQFNILPDVDGKVFFLRQANNYVSLKLQKGTTALIDITDKDLGSTIMCLNSCEGTVITIIQN